MANESRKVEVHLPEFEKDKPAVLIIREGQAEKINEPVRFQNEEITIGSIGEWYDKHRWPEDVKENPGVILFSIDPDSAWIKILENPKDTLATVLHAQIADNDDFTAWGINKAKVFSQQQLELQIRRLAHCFPNVDIVKDIIKRLQSFEARYEQVVKKEDDRSGNREDTVRSAIKLVKGELPQQLEFRIPLYYGAQPTTFTVDIEVDKMANNLPGFSFYSVDVELQRREQIQRDILAVVNKLRPSFACLEQ